ncbi:hypothetical protein ASZ90_011399 [hydrocarbon metagenome]|uniref:DUF5518 domain-containing protein n=1 Tax=hydrocarbon metagenome TaxID=938273 RepID=A0A0W8FDE2_9ZZZZ
MVILNPVLPVLGPLLGGFISGVLGRGGIWNGMLGGLVCALSAVLVISIIVIAGGTVVLGPLGLLLGAGVAALLLALVLYLGFFGMIGGAIGGAVKAHLRGSAH